eukprot:1193340-Prorocentrum_minimum.AAC.7
MGTSSCGFVCARGRLGEASVGLKNMFTTCNYVGPHWGALYPPRSNRSSPVGSSRSLAPARSLTPAWGGVLGEQVTRT